MVVVIYFLRISTDARRMSLRGANERLLITPQCINTSYEGRAMHHAYRYAGFGDVYILSVHHLHQRVTPRIIRDLHLLLPAASSELRERNGHRT